MTEGDRKYQTLIVDRDLWIYTILGFIIVIVGTLMAAYDQTVGFSLARLAESHRVHKVLFLFDALPLYIFSILLVARKNWKRSLEYFSQQNNELQETLDSNTDFAKKLSEGDDPDVYPGMLESGLGQALKLIQLNIKSNRRKEREITWITEGKDMISRILRIYDEIDELSYQILNNLSKYIQAIQGAVYIFDDDSRQLKNVATLAYNRRKYVNQTFRIGEGLVGQCAYEMDYIYRTEIPEDYVTITSGILGDQKPKSILLVPLITNEELQGIIEFAFLADRIPKLTIQFMLELGDIIARTLFNLQVNDKTRRLLEESRSMTEELRKNEKALHENAEEMKATQEQLQQTNVRLQEKIEEEKLAQDRLYWLLTNASEIIAIYDETINLKYISPSVEYILGYTTKEMVGGKDFQRMDQKGSNEIRKSIEKLKEDPGRTIDIEYNFVRKDGKRISLRSTIRNRLDDPSINGFIFNTRDITESKLIEKEQRLKSRMQSLSENSLDMILRISQTGVIYYANPVVEDYAGVAPSSLINKPLGDVPFNRELLEILQNILHEVNSKPMKYSHEISLPVSLGGKEGERILNVNVIPEFQENELETILIVGHDITEAKRIEKEIKVTNRKMQDSINYAERIQSSILPTEASMRVAFPESFIYYMPRDVISGDFPWFYETDDAWFVAAIDCTGHGVPGALLSFIGFFLLNNIISLHPEKSAGEICDMLNQEVRKTLKQDGKNPDTRDGMDLALCKIFKNHKKMEFVGAHRPMYLLRKGELIVHKGERKAIGGMVHPKKPETSFTTSNIDLLRGDKLFIFSDGLTDQLGGPEGLKYSPGRIREALLENPGYTISQFQAHFRKDFSTWLGEEKQIDDVLLIGIEF